MSSKKKKSQRTGHRNYIKTLVDKTKEILAKYDSSSAMELQLKQMEKSLKDRAQIIQKLDEAILDSIEEQHLIEKEIEEAGKFKENIDEILIMVADKMAPKNDNNSSQENSSTRSNPTRGNSSMKLPKLVLKKFSGDPIEFQQFWDSYRSAIHENSSLSEIEKFNYLRSLLEGNALRTIAGLPLTTDNYGSAVDMLQERFGEKQVIISSHMDALIKLPVASNADTKRLRVIYDTAEKHIRGLDALGIDSDQYGNLLVPILMSKIPSELQLVITRKLGKDKWDLKALLEAFKQELEAREMCSLLSTTHLDDKKKPSTTRMAPTSAQALFTEQQPRNQSPRTQTVYCTYCRGEHQSKKCHIVTDIKSRMDFLRRRGKCFICLKTGHMSRDCPTSRKCFNCNRYHHISLCDKQSSAECSPQSNVNNATPQAQSSEQPTDPKPATTCVTTSREGVLLQTATAVVYNPGNPRIASKARILFDSGSQKSYITRNLKDEICLSPCKTDTLSIKTFASKSELIQDCEVVTMCVKGIDGVDVSVTAHVVPVICSPIHNQIIEQAQQKFPHLQQLQLADSTQGNSQLDIDILVGSDFYWQFIKGGVIKGPSGPTALDTHLGWILSGPTSEVDPSSNSTNVMHTHVLKITEELEGTPVDDISPVLKQFWSLESIGILPEEQNPVHKKFLNDIQFDGERYSVKLPFKEQHALIPDNYQTCERRLGKLLSRLRENPEVLEEYDAVLKDQQSKGIIEDVTEAETTDVGKVHYIPHHCVIRQESKTTKLRVVYDASCKTQNVSLNSVLNSGPSLNPNLYDILLRFRCHKYAVVADIEKAFLQVEVTPEHRDFLRFLWIKDIKDNVPEIVVKRMTRVMFGVTSSPFLLAATLNHHISKYEQFTNTADELMRSFYVDDLVSGTNSIEQAYQFSVEAKNILKEGGFTLRKWSSNSKELIDQIHSECHDSPITKNNNSVVQEDSSYANLMLGNSKEQMNTIQEQKVLGLVWDTEHDQFVFRFEELIKTAQELELTKRSVLRVIASIYDPLGFLSPIIIPMKMLFQELCVDKCDWDSALSEDSKKKWMKWIDQLKNIHEVRVNRYCLIEPYVSIELHSFCDASMKAYAVVSYLRVECENHMISTSLITAKSRVAPLTSQGIPRLELLGALCQARLVSAVKKALTPIISISSSYCWTDSITTLYWIIGTDKEYKQFVENRVREIRRLTSTEDWHHVRGKENPADLPSRGLPSTEEFDNELWWHGPEWLCKPKEHWPNSDDKVEETPEASEELKKTSKVSTTLHTSAAKHGTVNLDNVIDSRDYSNTHRLYKITAYILRFISNCKKKVQNAKLDFGPITSLDLVSAEIMWLRTIQCSISNEPRFRQIESSLGLFKDVNSVLRCGGRIANADIPELTKFPILLPRQHHLTILIIRECHERVMHNGIKETLSSIRERYWIVKGRQSVKKVLNQCIVCRKFEGKPYFSTRSANLPEFRVSIDFPFTNVGVDFAGPLYVKTSGDGKAETSKAYIALYTCASTRAVHLELTPDLSVDAFIRSLRRFIGRRSIPSLIVSDNAKTFKSAEKKLVRLFDTSEVQDFMTSKKIQWKYNIEKAPWWGGFFERMVKCAKRCLKKTLGRSRLNYDELNTILVEIEAVLNSRPLTYVSSDEVEEVLTPSHLLIGKRIHTLPDPTLVQANQDPELSLKKRMKYLQKLSIHFWSRWQKEYLLELREHHRVIPPRGSNPQIQVNDIVCIHEEKTPRSLWRLARVKQIIKGNDGLPRGAVVTVGERDKKATTLRRPIQKLFPLEVSSEEKVKEKKLPAEKEPPAEEKCQENKTQKTMKLRPRRLKGRLVDN